MDFVKREDNLLDEDPYKNYMDSIQKSHGMESIDYQHAPLTMEQIHQAMQSSLNASSIVHNFQLPLSPRQMSTLMLKTNHLARNLNFNEVPPAHVQNLHKTFEIEVPMSELPQNLGRDDDMLSQNLSRNLDVTLSRTLNSELELQNGLPQNLSEHDLARNLTADLSQNLSRINDNLSQVSREGISHEIAELDLSHHLNRQNIDQIMNERRTPLGQCVDNSLLDQNLAPQMRIDSRLDQILAQRLESFQQRDQKLDQIQRLDQRLMNGMSLHESLRMDNEHLLPMPFHIKSEQEEDAYFYDNINQGLPSSALNGHILHTDHIQTNTANVHQEQIYSYNNHMPIPALNPMDLYTRPQNFAQNYAGVTREDPQNLVVHRQFENSSPYTEKKSDTEKPDKNEPKENQKPDQNKIYYDYNQTEFAEKNENDGSLQNKLLSDELTLSIKGEYICYKCSEFFPSKRILKQHSKNCDKGPCEKQGKFSCSQCPYRCQSPAVLKIHERTHTGEKPYSCTFCSYKSGQKNNVAKHILVHMKEKPFRCHFCDYRCAQKNNLVVHERTHTGYKPFACLYCDYRTVQKPNLVKHMYLHTDQKPFSCDMCSYRCVQKTNLTKHKQRHLHEKDGDKGEVKTQVKPYRPRQKTVKCEQCSYRCVQKSSLEKHMQYKHSVPDSSDACNDTVHNLSTKDYESEKMELNVQ